MVLQLPLVCMSLCYFLCAFLVPKLLLVFGPLLLSSCALLVPKLLLVFEGFCFLLVLFWCF